MKKLLSIALCITVALSAVGVTAFAQIPPEYATYTVITDGAEFQSTIENDISGSYYLANDITLPEDYIPIAEFAGKLVGDPQNPPSITLNIQDDAVQGTPVGLFRTLTGEEFLIQNLILKGSVEVTKSAAVAGVGALAGRTLSDGGIQSGEAAIVNCINYVDITVNGTANWREGVGGFVGETIDNASRITLSGLINYGNITNHNTSSVGGIIGYAGNNTVLSGCENYGGITGDSSGGIAGRSDGNTDQWGRIGSLENCYNAGAITGKTAGGIVSYLNASLPVKGCVNAGTVNGSYTLNPMAASVRDASTAPQYSGCFYLDESGVPSPTAGIEPTTVEALLALEGLSDTFKMALENIDRPYLLSSAEMENGLMEPAFNKNIFQYEIAMPDEMESFPALSYVLEAPDRATAEVQHASAFGEATTVTVTANDGRKRVYTFTIRKYSEMGISEDNELSVNAPVLSPDNPSGGQQVAATALVTNMTPSAKTAALILVATRNNEVIAGQIADNQAIPTGRTTLNASITLPSDMNNVNVTAFVVSDTATFQLLCEPVSLSDNSAASFEASADPVAVSFKELRSGVLTMTGTPGKPDTDYVAIALQPGKTIDFTAPLEETFTLLTVVRTNAQGSYGIDIGVTGESGDYTFLLFDPDTGKMLPDGGYPFFFASFEERESMVKNLYAQTDPESLASIMDLGNPESDCVKMLGLDASLFITQTLSSASFSKVLYNIMKENKPGESEMLERFMEQYSLSILIERLNQGLIGDISVYRNEFLLSDEAMAEYNKLTEAQKKTVSTVEMANNAFIRVKDISPVLREKSVLVAINEAANAAALRQIVEAQADYLEITSTAMSAYKNLSAPQKTKVAENLLENSYNSLADFASAFAREVRNINYSPGSGNGSGSGTGTGSGSGSGSFSNNGNHNVTITPTSKPEPTDTPVFQDLEDHPWAKEAIETLYQKGIVSGVTEELFEPDRNITREEFIKLLTGILPDSGSVENLSFSDVDESAWYAPYLEKAIAAGVAQGKEDGTFGIGEGLTREDMAVFASRVLNQTDPASETLFKDDSSIADYAKTAVYQLRAQGILSGTGDNTFEPKRLVTRAEAAQVIYNLLGVYSGGNN